MAQNTTNRLGAGWLIAGGFLLLAAIATLTVIFFPSDAESPSSGQEEPEENTEATNEETTAEEDEQLPPAEEPETGDDDSGVEACDLDDADSDFPATAPEFTWEDHPGGLVLPVSEEHGPVVRDGEFWRCTSQTPAGAAFAGISLYHAFDAGVQEAAEDSPRARSLFEENQELDQEADGVVRGFQITSSSDEAATIEYWMEPPNEDTAISLPLSLVWDEQANDWRIDFSDGRPDFSLLEDTSDFTEWR